MSSAGALICTTPRELAESAEVIVTMLPDLPELAEVLSGPDGVLAAPTRRRILVVC